MKDFLALAGTNARPSFMAHPPNSAGEAHTLEQRCAARAELDAVLGQAEADQLLCSMARREGDPAFGLALLARALASARATKGGISPAFPRPPIDQQGRSCELPREAIGQDTSHTEPGDLLIEIPLPRSLIAQGVAGRSRHG